MLYLIDANVLIDANRDYYPLSRIPEFWEWLLYMGRTGNIKIPREILEEVTGDTAGLPNWLRRPESKEALLLEEEADPVFVSRVVYEGYATDLTEDEIEKLGRDPFLIAYGLVDPACRCVVTTESSKPSKLRANRHIPDVCRSLGVSCCNTFNMLHELDFRTDWGDL
ncbi:MAG: DUF4411 family protein [Candidatus Hydrogenedentes bacterium]|nr:DUF4411 family protein [Candidatus Hydrogenedentota bacterium]